MEIAQGGQDKIAARLLAQQEVSAVGCDLWLISERIIVASVSQPSDARRDPGFLRAILGARCVANGAERGSA